MKKSEVTIGFWYTAKIGGELAVVEILAAAPDGGWEAVDVITGKPLRFRTARNLRYTVHPQPVNPFSKGQTQ
mgnify:FL=1